MHSIELDESNNILILKISGFMDNEDMLAVANDFRENLEKMKKGFVFINDVSEFVPPMAEAHVVITEAMKILNEHEPRMVIRVSDGINRDADDQFDKALNDANPDYVFHRVPTLEDALFLAKN